MPVIIAIIGILSAAAIWYYRAQAAQRAAGDLMDVANDVRLAARRFGFKRKLNTHPVDSIDDARLAGAGIVAAIAGMGTPLGQPQIDEMTRQFQSVFGADKAEAVEIATFARWIAEQCGTRSEAVRRLSKRLAGLAGTDAHDDLQKMIDAVIGSRGPSDDQTDAKDHVTRLLKP